MRFDPFSECYRDEMETKPHLQLPIVESGAPLIPMPKQVFAYQEPHVYQALGAPYGEASPFYVREPVLQALIQAQAYLQQDYPDWQISIFDAYRPVAVQAFMVNYTFERALEQRQWRAEDLTPAQTDEVWQQVYQMWAAPNLDPKAPPPHSTGAAVDITLYDRQSQDPVFMGSPIDELSERSHPDYFTDLANNPTTPAAEQTEARLAAQHRQILYTAMRSAGFQRHPKEWWHFGIGDQLWAWLTLQENPEAEVIACYGRV